MIRNKKKKQYEPAQPLSRKNEGINWGGRVGSGCWCSSKIGHPDFRYIYVKIDRQASNIS